jgi:hypothetical protein
MIASETPTNPMIVYGDAEYSARADTLACRLQARGDAAQSEPSLEALRTWLILAGQVEQAICDSGIPSAALENLTDAVAAAFVCCWFGDGTLDDQLTKAGNLSNELSLPPEQVRLKLPEGFANYALLPDQYVVSARKWTDSRTPGQTVAVMGLRSIGTSLSAVVAATLRRAGFSVRRTTVRPHGHPFERKVSSFQVGPAAEAVIVDEGPGLSGSSMAAVALAARGAGLAPNQITFLPGHANGPGAQASATTRALWKTTPQIVTNLEDLRFGGQSIRDALAAETSRLTAAQPVSVDDLSGGAWREFVFSHREDWPAVAENFERPKILVSLDSGEAVLWKFAGLACLPIGLTGTESAFRELHRRAEGGWSKPPLAHRFGFVAQPWVAGRPLGPCDFNSSLWDYMLRYAEAVRQPPLETGQAAQSLDRIESMLQVNCREALGEDLEDSTRDLAATAREWGSDTSPQSYGDGRLAPHEWIRDPAGRIWKVDGVGHDWDHTVVGPQPWIWDLAGLLTEWHAEPQPRDDVPPEVLRFYGAAYSAFRLGLLVESSKSTSNPGETALFHQAISRYRESLLSWLR